MIRKYVKQKQKNVTCIYHKVIRKWIQKILRGNDDD